MYFTVFGCILVWRTHTDLVSIGFVLQCTGCGGNKRSARIWEMHFITLILQQAKTIAENSFRHSIWNVWCKRMIYFGSSRGFVEINVKFWVFLLPDCNDSQKQNISHSLTVKTFQIEWQKPFSALLSHFRNVSCCWRVFLKWSKSCISHTQCT